METDLSLRSLPTSTLSRDGDPPYSETIQKNDLSFIQKQNRLQVILRSLTRSIPESIPRDLNG